jgi:serine/threonine protein kinase
MYMPTKVAEGGYGCVFRPALECSNNKLPHSKKSGYVSKAMTERHADDELQEYARIDKADPGNKYHLEAPQKCKLNQTPTNLKSIRECNVLKKVPLLDVALLQLKDGGVSLKEFAISRPTKPEMENFLVDFYNVVLSLKLLQDNGLHHMDLKPHNIVYNPRQRLMLLIDFGLMVSDDEIADFYEGKPISHWNYPPEVYSLRHHSARPDDNCYNKTILNYQATHGTKNVIEYLEFDPHEAAEYIQYFEMDIQSESIDDIRSYSMLTHDVFGMGLSLLYVIRLNRNKLDANVFLEFDRIGKEMMQGAPSLRLSPDEAIIQYELALESTGILRSQRKKIVDGAIVARDVTRKSESQKIMSRIRKIPAVSAARLETIAAAEPPGAKPIKTCPAGKELVGKRCLKACAAGWSRNPATNRCAKTKTARACPEGKELNPDTGRCIKTCGPGQVRSAKTRRCVKSR